MDEYPEELRTPPVSLVSLVGCSELHTLISTHLHSEQPPINTLALPDFSKISIMAKTQKDASASAAAQPAGILKRDWLTKHRTRVPAVVAALFSANHVSGDPAQWLQVCTDLENVKVVIRGRSIKLIVVLVTQSTSKDGISEDRMIALRKRAEVDSKYLIVFDQIDPLELKPSLKRLGNTFAELAYTYYRDEGRKIKTRLERKSFNSNELNIRYCFKAAVYAEFRRDWVEASRLYDDAYHVLRAMIGTSTRLPPIQRLIEIKTVAEQLHFKISTLLLHSGNIVEAITQFRQHNSVYKKLMGVPEVVFLHWDWLSRQFLVFAELLETGSSIIQNLLSPGSDGADGLTEWEFNSAHYYQLAAQYLKEKRSCLELALSLSDSSVVDAMADSIVPSVYVGQFARLIEQGDVFAMQPISDEEYVHYALAEGKRFQDSFEIIALLKNSYKSYNNSKSKRMASYCGFQIAREYFSVSEFNNAKQLFDSVANLYRQEGWVILLWEVLGYLRECSRRLGSVKDFVEYSLEMAALPVSSIANVHSSSLEECGLIGPASVAQREIIHTEVFRVVTGGSWLPSNEDSSGLRVTSDQPLHLEIDLVSPLRVVLLASVAFHEHMVKLGETTLITLSLLSQLPFPVEIDYLDVQFNQPECNFTIMNGQRPQVSANSIGQQDHRVEKAPSLTIVTNKWLRLTYDVKSEQSGKLECVSVIARMGTHFTICCRAESPASMNDIPLWKFENYVETFPTKDPVLALSGQKATQIEEPDPQVDLTLGASGPALVGENFILPITVTSKGHAIHFGELKINLVDTRGGGLLSPREVEPFSADNLHVELLGICGQECEDSQTGINNIRKIQPSFGLISIPFIDVGGSWLCELEIKWHRPKPIMAYVSLGYSAHNNEPCLQKLHVHKNLQIEGKIALSIGHRFVLPFRRDPLLLSKIKRLSDSNRMPSLPVNEASILIVSARNCAEVPLQLLSMSISVEDDIDGRVCTVQHRGKEVADPALLVPGEEFKRVFSVIPKVNFPKLKMGSVCLRWRRDSRHVEHSGSNTNASEILTQQTLPDVDVELSPLVVSLECPSHAILGNPFTYIVRIQNPTMLLQEIKFSVADSQGFVLSGYHSDTVFILPKSEHILSYKLVPLASGSQQLPKVMITGTRYSAAYEPSIAASVIFVFPSKPRFMMTDMEAMPEAVAAE